MFYIKKIIDYVMDTLETIVFVGSIFIVVYIFIGFPTGVQGASMEPTLHTSDRLLINRIAYKFDNPKRGDIVVITSPKNPDIDYVKRIIGLPGEKIMISKGDVFINDEKISEDYISSITNTWEGGFIKEGVPVSIPIDHIFVMGDNRIRSSDSREFGPVPLKTIIGKAVYQYFPFKLFFNNVSETSYRMN